MATRKKKKDEVPETEALDEKAIDDLLDRTIDVKIEGSGLLALTALNEVAEPYYRCGKLVGFLIRNEKDLEKCKSAFKKVIRDAVKSRDTLLDALRRDHKELKAACKLQKVQLGRQDDRIKSLTESNERLMRAVLELQKQEKSRQFDAAQNDDWYNAPNTDIDLPWREKLLRMQEVKWAMDRVYDEGRRKYMKEDWEF